MGNNFLLFYFLGVCDFLLGDSEFVCWDIVGKVFLCKIESMVLIGCEREVVVRIV